MPYLLYCIEIWGNSYKTHLKPLQVLQKKAVRVVAGAPYLAHTNNFFLDFRFLKLQDLIDQQMLLLIYKAYINLLPPQLQNCFKQVYVTSVRARTNNNFQVNFNRTNVKAIPQIEVLNCGIIWKMS